MLEKLQLSADDHHLLYSYCSDKGIEFMSTAFDSSSLRFLVEELGIQRLNIASGEITNGPFLVEHAQTGLSVVLSTGMASLCEIRQALAVLACGYLGIKYPPTSDHFGLIDTNLGHDVLKDNVTLLQCTTQYPAPIEESNIKAVMGMRDELSLDVGYSDHTLGITASIVAVSFGATIIEKHITLDKTFTGPDHAASLEPRELIDLVKAIEDVERCVGKETKEIQPSEIENIDVARKSIVAARKIKNGEVFSRDNLAIKRPGSGLSPMEFWSILGSKSTRSYKEGELID